MALVMGGSQGNWTGSHRFSRQRMVFSSVSIGFTVSIRYMLIVFTIDSNEKEQPDVFDLTVAALHRATGPNLGSICLSSLIVAIMRFLGRAAVELRRVCIPSFLAVPLS